MPTQGNFATPVANGVDVTDDFAGTTYTHELKANETQAQNTGIKRYSPGAQNLDYAVNGAYRRHGMGVNNAHNLFSPAGVGAVNDTEFIISEPRGVNALGPTIGDLGVIFDGTLMNYSPSNPKDGQMGMDVQFRPRGKRSPLFPFLLYTGTGLKTATNFSSNPYDDGAEGNGTLLGAVGVLQIKTPTGTQATGTASLTGQPANNDKFTFTFNAIAYAYTFKTALTPTAGEVLIGATTAATIANLFAAMTGGIGSGTTYAAGTVAVPSTLITVSVPSATNVITFTAVLTGTAANSNTLVATTNVSTFLAVSGANMAGGVAGDTYNITVASATTSGGSYTTLITHSGVGAVRGSFRTEVPIATLINEWLKLTVTLASGTGTVQTFAMDYMFGRFFQL